MRKIAIVCCASILLWSAVSLGLVGCTRARRETPTPVAPAAVASTAAPTGTQVFTPQAPPTPLSGTPGPTVVGVAEISPTVPSGQNATPGPASTPFVGQFDYTVQWYDTLFSLARRFNTTVDAIVALNGLTDPNSIRVGQVLKINGTTSGSSAPSSEYVVQPGDTLYSIARRFGTSVDAIRLANGIVNPWYISVGQKLTIPQATVPASSASGTSYVVEPGDTLYSIAARFQKNAWDIIVANNLTDPHWISVGQVLVIP